MNQQHPTAEQLIDYAHGELAAREDAAVHAHLSECASCREAYDADVRIGDLLRDRARSEELDMPPGLKTSIYARAASEPVAPWWQRLSASLQPAVAIAVAAAIFVMLGFLVFANWPRSTQRDAIDAAYYVENHAALATTTPFAEGAPMATVLTSDVTASDDSAAP